MEIKEMISDLRTRMQSEMASAENKQALEDIRVRMLGKKGELTAMLRSLGQLSPEERPADQ